MKNLWIPLAAAFGSMIILYTIGFIAKIDILVLTVSFSYLEISLLPIFIGLLVGLISERIIKLRSR